MNDSSGDYSWLFEREDVAQLHHLTVHNKLGHRIQVNSADKGGPTRHAVLVTTTDHGALYALPTSPAAETLLNLLFPR